MAQAVEGDERTSHRRRRCALVEVGRRGSACRQYSCAYDDTRFAPSEHIPTLDEVGSYSAFDAFGI